MSSLAAAAAPAVVAEDVLRFWLGERDAPPLAAGAANGPLEPVAVTFLLMPFMHAEELDLQERAIDGFAKLAAETTDEKLLANFENSLKCAKMHLAVIERFGCFGCFGRFPHRNAILSRTSTAEELEFLKQPGSSF